MAVSIDTTVLAHDEEALPLVQDYTWVTLLRSIDDIELPVRVEAAKERRSVNGMLNELLAEALIARGAMKQKTARVGR